MAIPEDTNVEANDQTSSEQNEELVMTKDACICAAPVCDQPSNKKQVLHDKSNLLK